MGTHHEKDFESGGWGLEPGNAGHLKAGKGRKTDSTLRPPERKAALVTP